MNQLREIVAVRQDPQEPPRRWFWSNIGDLMVWLDEDGVPTGFQLSYDKDRAERVLTWKPESGFLHTAVDDGESDVGFRHKATPLLIADGYFDAKRVLELFRELSTHLPPKVVGFVTEKIKQHPNYEVRA